MLSQKQKKLLTRLASISGFISACLFVHAQLTTGGSFLAPQRANLGAVSDTKCTFRVFLERLAVSTDSCSQSGGLFLISNSKKKKKKQFMSYMPHVDVNRCLLSTYRCATPLNRLWPQKNFWNSS